MKQYHYFFKIKSVFILVGLFGLAFLSGCRLLKHKQYTKYGAPSTYYKKMNTNENTSKTLIKDSYKLLNNSF